MAADIYYLIGEERHGPISKAELAELAATGVVTPETQITKAGMKKWVPASKISGLQFIAPDPAPAIPEIPPVPAPPPAPQPVAPVIPSGEGVSTTEAPQASEPGAASGSEETTAQPVIAPGPVAGNAEAATAPRKPARKVPWTIVFGSLAGLVIIGMAVTIAFLLANQPKPDELAQRREDLKAEVAKLEESIEELKEKQEATEEETKAAKSQLDEVASEVEKKTREKEAVEEEIANLVSYREKMKAWQDVDFALANPTEFAFGIKHAPSGLQAVMKATGKEARDALGAVRNAGIVRLSRNRQLTRDLVNNVDVDVRIPATFEKQIHQLYRPHRFIQAAPGDEPQFVSFFDHQENRMRFGVFVDANDDELIVQTVSKQAETLPRSRIREGSVRIGTAQELASTLSERNFLDYVILNVAHKLGSEFTGEGSDERRLLLPTEEYAGERTYRPEYISLAVHCEHDDVASINDRVRILRLMFKTKSTKRDGSSFSTTTRTRIPIYPPRKHIPADLKTHLLRVEDEIYDRIVSAGLPAIENELPDGYDPEDTYVEGPIEAADRRHATHLLIMQVQKAKGGGDYYLAARLMRIRDRRLLWSSTGDQFLSDDLIEQPYHMNSGDLALFHFEKDTYDDFPGIEHPSIVKPTGIAHADYKYSYLVYSENYTTGEEFVRYRMPFSKMPFSTVRRLITKYEPIDQSLDIPRHWALRYAACRASSKLMPAAGRVLELKGNEATVSIGRRDGVRADQKLAVFRVNRELKEKFQELQAFTYGSSEFGETPVLDERSFTESRTLLPQEVNVKEVFDRHSRVFFTPTKMERYWGDTAGQLLENDIVVLNKRTPLQIKVIPAEERFNLSNDLAKRLGYVRNPGAVRGFYEPACHRARQQIINVLQSSFTSQNVPVATKSSDNSPTHEVIVSVQLSDNMVVNSRQNTSKPVFRVAIGIRPTTSTTMVDRFEFDLSDDGV